MILYEYLSTTHLDPRPTAHDSARREEDQEEVGRPGADRFDRVVASLEPDHGCHTAPALDRFDRVVSSREPDHGCYTAPALDRFDRVVSSVEPDHGCHTAPALDRFDILGSSVEPDHGCTDTEDTIEENISDDVIETVSRYPNFESLKS